MKNEQKYRAAREKLKAASRNFVEWGDIGATADAQRNAWKRLAVAAIDYAHEATALGRAAQLAEIRRRR